MIKTKKETVYYRSRTPARKISLFIGVLVLFLTIPLLTYITYKQQNIQSHAAPSTSLTFSQSTLQVNPGDNFSLDIIMNPGGNVVFLTNLVIDYDASVIKPATNGILPNNSVFPTTIAGPNYNNCIGNQCSMSISLSVGNPTQAIQKQATIATVNFQTVGQGLTTITFDQQTKVFSIASSDQADENVLSTSTPSVIFVGTGAFPTLTAAPAATAVPTIPGYNPSSVCHFEKPISCPQVCVSGQPCPPPCNPVWVCPNPTVTPTPAPACTTRVHDSDADVEKQLVAAREHIDAIEKDLDLLANNKRLSATDRLTVAQKINSTLDSTEKTISADETALKPTPTPIHYSGSSVGVILSNIISFFQNLFHQPPTKK